MNPGDFEFVLYGVELLPFVIGIVALVQYLGLSEYWSEWLRAGLLGGLALLVMNQAALAEQIPGFEDYVLQALTVLGVILSSKGLWPDLRKMWNRAVGSGIVAAGEPRHNMRRF